MVNRKRRCRCVSNAIFASVASIPLRPTHLCPAGDEAEFRDHARSNEQSSHMVC